MSSKKFTRSHGKTARIKKYRWSNPDHRWSDSTCQRSAGRPGLRGYVNVPGTKVRFTCHGGVNCRGVKSGEARHEHRSLRRLLDAEIRVYIRGRWQ